MSVTKCPTLPMKPIGMPRIVLLTLVALFPAISVAHPSTLPVDEQANAWLESFTPEARGKATFSFDDPERYRFRWTPGQREGVKLDELDDAQRHALRDLLRTVLSEAGANKVDAIIATEAALGVLTNATSYRDPEKYWTAIFGNPGEANWGLRFEGHHLSVNLTFSGAKIVSGSPLFLGANPETVPSGPDAGLRALAGEVDLARELYLSLDEKQREVARGSEEWFVGFLTSAGERRANLGKPAGIAATALNDDQKEALRRVIAVYVESIAPGYAAPYLERAFAEEWPDLRFFWEGSEEPGKDYYYRIAGKRLLIEHENRSGGTHVHAVWRDAEADFGGM